MRSGFWKSDWFLGLAVVVAVVGINLFSDAIEGLERKAYDVGVQLSVRAPSDRIAVIAIDDESISNIGRWPWSRDVHATMVDLLAGARAKVIGSTILLSESEVEKNKGYSYVTKLLALAANAAAPAPRSGVPSQSPPRDTAQFVALLREAERELNTDRKLAESYAKASNVLVPLDFAIGEPRGRPDKPLPEYVRRNAIAAIRTGSDLVPPPTSEVRFPIEPIGKAAAGLGSLTQYKDEDGAIRIEPLVLGHFDELYPALSMMVVARYLNLGPTDIKAHLGEGVTLQKLRIRTDGELKMRTFFYRDYRGRPAFQVDSFYDVFVKKIPAEKYRDKIVLIGATASGLGDNPATPIAPSMAPVLLLAHSVSSILQEHFFVAPAWGVWSELVVFVLVACYLTLLLPRLKAGPALAISVGIFAVLIVVHFSLMMASSLWIKLMLPVALLVMGHAALISKRFIVTEAAKVRSEESSAESNRMLGIAYQAQGQLDLAWDKFRQVPMSDAVMDNLYNLALDFERKRQFNKAESVFRHMHVYNAKYRDLAQKLSRARQLSETVILGGASRHPGGSLNLGAGEKPKFGRFEVHKELGKGAMGVVYLGKDPKIGREVAIKTMALSQEFEADELAEVKERFFREAETAGRLSHPNIVTIYDTGEEHDFCYIAMELLKGGDLAPYVKAANLLPADKAVSIVARAADALGYAHRQNVVHRDIKPANMMYHAETDTLKLTDFGIARLTDSSRTRTGMVLGTPSYMSPEQLAGKKIEGRSDLFSLAVSLYQLLCGRLPFEGESMAQLMYRIANEPPTDILAVNPDLPPGLVAFLDRALAKNPDERYQTADEFAAALRAAARASTASGPGRGVDIEL